MTTALVTGGTGCIGAVTVRDLLARGVGRVVVASRASDRGRLSLWLGEAPAPRLALLPLDLEDGDAVARLVAEVRPSHVVHLAALQSPDCDRDPARGLRVNVGGTQALLEACEDLAAPLQRFVFASSAAVYGPRALYAGPTVREHDPLAPPNRYGVWKLAGEQLLRLFHGRTRVPTVCLRLNTTYGPGRDRGLTSAVTKALECVALGGAQGRTLPFRMPYRGRENYHYVEDVGACFAAAALQPHTGFASYNLRGTTVDVGEFLAIIAEAAGSLGIAEAVDLGIADDAGANLFVSDLDETAVQRAFPGAPKTPLQDGVARSLRTFLQLARAGNLAPPR
jgi:nucleoside-diphosphate-sugar epimerase